jgi:hypothetical protein
MAAQLREIDPMTSVSTIARLLSRLDVETSPGSALRALIAAGLDQLPMPGSGATIDRWRCLAAVARHDLALVKLYESHVDALSILRELGGDRTPRPGDAYAVWASESRADPLTIRETGIEAVAVAGRKAWCSGAASVDRGLMTATDRDGRRCLVEVELRSPGVSIDGSLWRAVGMRESASAEIACDQVPARRIGPPGWYLERPGFWHGGAGIAACWFGAASQIGARVRDLQDGRDDVHALAHLGAIDGELGQGAALLREAAAWIDAHPRGDAGRIALRARTSIADMAERVIGHAMRAIGPGPLCNEAALARLVADLPIFVRQSRGEHDRVGLARLLLADADEAATPGWSL